MWVRALAAMRGAAWDVLWRIGRPAVSVPLAAAAALHVAIFAAWTARGSPDGAHAFATSSASWALAAALIVDSAIAVLQGLRMSSDATGAVRLGRIGRGDAGALLVRGGYLLAALGFAASLAGRDRLEIRCAVGEECTASREQAVARDPPRRFSPGPFPLRVVPEAVHGAVPGRRSGAAPRVDLRADDGSFRTATRWRPLWQGWGRFLRPVATGDVLRYEIAAERGATLDSAFVKLDLAAGATDSILPERFPHRIYVLADPEGPPGPRLRVAVYRGKQRVAAADVGIGEPVAFEGLVLTFAEWRPWVQLEMLRDPGIPLGLLGAALAAIGIAVERLARRR